MTNKLYVDDLRPIPDGWDGARNFHKAIVMLEENEYDEVSLDNDIASFYGNREMMGYDILQWLIMRKMEGLTVPSIVKVHSANPVQNEKMQQDINRHFGD